MMQIVHLAHGQATTETGFSDWLEVRRGRTQFPHRPLTSTRYLIGSGTNCHLQLGGGLPMLHSLLLRNADYWTLEAIAPEPPLLVNDQPRRNEVLRVGDAFRIADLEFVLRRQETGRPMDHLRDRQQGRGYAANSFEEAEHLSTHELVDRLEWEFDVIEQMEHTRLAGATALLRAIRRHANPAGGGASEPLTVRSPGENPPTVNVPPRRAA